MQRVRNKGSAYSDNDFYFYAKKVDFGVGERMTLKVLRVYGEGEITVRVDNGQRYKNVKVSLKGEPKSIRLDMVGDAFGVEVILGGNARITEMQADVAYVRRNGIRGVEV